MSLRNKIVPLIGVASISLAGLVGCGNDDAAKHPEWKLSEMNKQQAAEQRPETRRYFAEIYRMDPRSPVSVTSGDFNNDGYLDLVVASVNDENNSFGRTTLKLYFFEGDGKGNFKLRQYPVE